MSPTSSLSTSNDGTDARKTDFAAVHRRHRTSGTTAGISHIIPLTRIDRDMAETSLKVLNLDFDRVLLHTAELRG